MREERVEVSPRNDPLIEEKASRRASATSLLRTKFVDALFFAANARSRGRITNRTETRLSTVHKKSPQ